MKELKIYSEKKIQSFLNSSINTIKVDNDELNQTINDMFKWEEKRKTKNLEKRELMKDKDLLGCTFKPELDKKSMEMTRYRNRSLFFNKSQGFIGDGNKTSRVNLKIERNYSEFFAPDGHNNKLTHTNNTINNTNNYNSNNNINNNKYNSKSVKGGKLNGSITS